jgi:HlyD family secretion protein
MGMRKILWLLPLVAVLAAGTYAYWRYSTPPGPRFDIQTVELRRGDVRRVVSTAGKVQAIVTVEVGSQLSGQITELHADHSDTVPRNGTLARIDPGTFETRVREAESGVGVARATVAVQEATLSRADTALRKAERDLERSQALAAQGNVSQAALDTARSNFDAARADFSMARAQLQNAVAALAQRQATLASARIDLDRTYIRSPIDGVVLERSVELGQTVSASLSAPKLFTVAQDLREVQVSADIDEADIGQVALGNEATFQVDAFPDVRFSGKVSQIRLAPHTIQNVVTYTVIVSVGNATRQLFPGMTANLDIVTGERSGVLTVANEALRFQPRGAAEGLVQREGEPAANGGSAAGPAAALNQLLERLQTTYRLKDETIALIRQNIRNEMVKLRSGQGNAAAGSADGEGQAREVVRVQIAGVMREVLTPEQFRQFEEAQKRFATVRAATIWLQRDDGKLVSRRVGLGMADANVSEIIAGDLPAGSKAVIRVREAARK